MTAVHVLGCALVGGLLGLLVPVLIARLPEPAADPDESEEDVAERAKRAAMPFVDLWGMRPDDDTKELYVEMAGRRAVRVGSVIAGAVCGAALGALYGFAPVQVGLLALLPVLLALAIIDWRTRLLPTALVNPATLAVVVLALVALPIYDTAFLLRAVIGAVIAYGFYFVLWFFGGAGYGDVRLAGLIGFVLAYVGWSQWLLGLWAGTLLFSVPGLVLAIARRDRRLLKAGFPFGPFMILGVLVGLTVGGPAIDALVNA